MATKRIPVGVIIKEIIDEKSLRPQDVADALRINRQNIYLIYNRSKMSDTELRKWAKALGVTKEEIEKRMSLMVSETGQGSQSDAGNYLMEYLAKIETEFRALKDQLHVKDTQIASLQELLKMSLGKPDLGGNTPCGKVLPMPVEQSQEEEMEAA
ncbi:hypothetical protein SAMN04487996_1042 [Dyadobacter soli]|uniref:HTH cro/C1-type domain-containing protein n=1 Tax=Dyadobacter soli TaxID=659014 RepID=A0A1G7AXX9_9BACT|nr:helix-turn-helix transcriptional regulator [Dyadobacter soli]SDE19437.1 hypothetical protein SAMN04487996_1042 [Dyadobacter soli]